MICPNCQSGDVVVRDTRETATGRQRRRYCRACNARWMTHEEIVEGSLSVSKREPSWWRDARSLKRKGVSDREVAAELGKALHSVQYALRPTARARLLAYQREARADGGLAAENVKRQMRREARP